MKKITEDIVGELYSLLSPCRLCPNDCRAERSKGETGSCRSGRELKVSSYHQHFGEEPQLVGTSGSGTVFFAYCNMHCVFCQNHDISQSGIGQKVTVERLSRMMIELQELGCHNINLVTPTPWVPQIVDALMLAQAGGLTIPAVYNCGGYESVKTLRLLEGVIDIFMPDIKYGDDSLAFKYSGVKGYWVSVQMALLEMQRQVGDLLTDRRGIAQRGLLIRHLVLPGGLAGTAACLAFISKKISSKAAVNIMDQYHPAFRASEYPELNRRITPREYQDALKIAGKAGLRDPDAWNTLAYVNASNREKSKHV
jgi:putative pyruvate formate lyase activating enzyme